MFMSNCSYIQLPSLITAIALTLAPCMTNEELSIAVVALTQLADTFDTILTQRDIAETQKLKPPLPL